MHRPWRRYKPSLSIHQSQHRPTPERSGIGKDNAPARIRLAVATKKPVNALEISGDVSTYQEKESDLYFAMCDHHSTPSASRSFLCTTHIFSRLTRKMDFQALAAACHHDAIYRYAATINTLYCTLQSRCQHLTIKTAVEHVLSFVIRTIDTILTFVSAVLYLFIANAYFLLSSQSITTSSLWVQSAETINVYMKQLQTELQTTGRDQGTDLDRHDVAITEDEDDDDDDGLGYTFHVQYKDPIAATADSLQKSIKPMKIEMLDVDRAADQLDSMTAVFRFLRNACAACVDNQSACQAVGLMPLVR